MGKDRMKRILVYSHDTFGLGNIRRMLEISRHLVASSKDISVLIVSGSPVLHAFRIPPRIDYIKLPCLARTPEGEYAVKFLETSYDQTIRLRSNLILSAVLDFEPDLLLVDKKPFGVGNELLATFDLLRRRGTNTRAVLLLRDILDAPEATIPVWRKNGYFEAIESFYDQVLVVGSRDVFDLTAEYDFPPTSSSKVRFCGYIGRQRGRATREQLRQEYGIGDDPLVLVTPGGGGDGYRVLSCYLRALRHLPAERNITSLLVCGPELSELQRARIAEAAGKAPRTIFKDFTDDMLGCMDAADLVVSMGGYNTVCELLTLGKRAIVVPRVKPVKEQWIRAQRLSRLGLLRTIHPESLSPALFAEALVEELDRGPAPVPASKGIDLGGLDRIEQNVAALLEGQDDVGGTARWANASWQAS